MSRPHVRHLLIGLAAAVLPLAALVAFAPAASASTTYNTFGGQAYGSVVAVGGTATSGHTAYGTLCTTSLGVTHTKTTGSVNAGALGTIGAVTTKVYSTHSGATVKSVATSQTAGATMLGGTLGLGLITTTAVMARTGSTYTGTTSTHIGGLTIAGVPVPVDATALDQSFSVVPGVTLLINHQSSYTKYGAKVISVTGVRLTITSANLLGLGTGSVVIGVAVASLHLPTHHLPYGSASGTTIQLGSTLKSGPTSPVYLPCGGSSGATRSNTAATLSVPSALSVGAVDTHAKSTDSATETAARTWSTIDSAVVLGGVVRVSGITAQAKAVRKNHGPVFRTSAGTTIGKLKVNGHYLPVKVPENTKIAIPGVGTLYLYRVLKTSTGLHVIALELVLSQAMDGLAKGTAIIVGSARAGVYAH